MLDQNISRKKLLFYFILSIIINSFGNALTVSINLGSALWTAASDNIWHMIPSLSLSSWLLIPSILVIIVNAIILKRIDVQRIIGNLIFLIPFSYLIGMLSTMLDNLGINSLPLAMRIILDCFGVVCISMAISIYQRVNWMLHPVDDFMQLIRFKYFKGNSTIAQLATFTPPIIAIIITVIFSHQIYAINIGTIFALMFQGTMVGIFDKIVFPTLKHQNLEN